MYPSSRLLRRRSFLLSLRRGLEDSSTFQLGPLPWASKWSLPCSKQCFLRHFSSEHDLGGTTVCNHGRGLTIGILRETYDKWERRAPLCPHHVQELIHKHGLDRVSFLVQPSSNRAFTNEEYVKAGATIVEDLSAADVILGVKRPRSVKSLTPRTTHLFFSHVIKGQPGNMPLLQEVLHKRIPLIDYECIVVNQDDVTPLSDQSQGQQKQQPSIGFASGSGGMQSTKSCEERRHKRLVAFGAHAGMAGMMDTFQALGRRLLWNPVTSWSTPFLNCPPAILHHNLAEVQRSVGLLGERIANEGLPPDLEPLVFTMTGKGGNVHSGVRHIFDGLPHEMVSIEDLPQLFREHQEGVWTPKHKVYGVELGTADIYQKKNKAGKIGTGDAATAEFDRSDFRDNPSDYESTFARRVAPYTHVLLNCIYWDQRFPRLLTKQDVKELYEAGNERLLVVADISCDVNGSIEFLERSTTIDKPFFQYDPVKGQEVSDDIEERGITMMGVDILPSELPVDSSNHFGNALSGVVEEFVHAQALDGGGIDVSKLSDRLKNAYITTADGTLATNFRYLDPIMKRPFKPIEDVSVDQDKRMVVMLKGHLFDSGLINQILDVLEQHNCVFEFEECYVRYPQSKGKPRVKSSAVLVITGSQETDLAKVEAKIETLVKIIESAEASFQRVDRGASGGAGDDPGATQSVMSGGVRVTNESQKTVLLLGAGRVSASVVELLGRSKDKTIVVASNDEEEARGIAAGAVRGRHACLDVNDHARLNELVREADIVISLLPAPFHPQVAELCINHHKNLVTASYESEKMRELGMRAKNAGITILNEVGLDPGLDHMSAMRIIDGVKERGGFVSSLLSVCGGLPSPEAAYNPLKYKFSWSPKGVISASQNGARYRWEDQVIEVYGKELLENASPFIDEWPDLHLECLPNRDSLLYEKVYGIESASTIFRGTLRYRGFSRLMHIFQNMGLFETVAPIGDRTWEDVLKTLRMQRGGFEHLEDFLLACAEDDMDDAALASKCLTWLGMTGAAKIKNPAGSVVDQFCDVLEKKLQYRAGERDMVVMYHAIGVEFEDGTKEQHKSSLQAFGNDSMSAMCKTVGYPTAAAASLILDGSLDSHRGLVLPTNKSVYVPILDSVEKEGIVFKESVSVETEFVKRRGVMPAL